MGVEKITKIILLLMKIAEGMHTKNKTIKQHDDRSVVLRLKNLFFDVLCQRTRTFVF